MPSLPRPSLPRPSRRHQDARHDARHEFRFDAAFRAAGWPFGIRSGRAWAEIDDGDLTVRFGPWEITTRIDNIASAQVTGPYAWPRVIGPPHLSLADRGITFATTARAGVCLQFVEPVVGLDPFGTWKIPSLTITVADPEALVRQLVAEGEDTGSGIGAIDDELHDELVSLTASELRDRARSQGLAFTSRHRKAELIDLLRAAPSPT